MSKIGVQGNFYLGVVSEVLGDTREEKQEYRIVADIPGVIKGIKAFPIRDTLDEPKPGDPVILLGLDPDYNSYYLYWKLKENDVTGFRSAGKEVVMTPDEIVARVYNDSGDYEDHEKEPAEEIASIRIKESGEIVASNRSQTTITVGEEGDIDIQLSGHTCTFHNGILTLGSLAVTEGMGGGFVNSMVWGEKGTPIPFTNSINIGG